jgi:hypothetical protein
MSSSSLTKITNKDNLLKLTLQFTHVKLIKLERHENNWIKETIEQIFSKSKEILILQVDDFENQIIIIILELNKQPSNLVFCNQNKQSNTELVDIDVDVDIDVEDQEMKDQLNGIKNLFGGEMDLSSSSIEETNDVFNNFGKGLSSLFSIQPQIQQPNLISLKNENNKISFNIKKKLK